MSDKVGEVRALAVGVQAEGVDRHHDGAVACEMDGELDLNELLATIGITPGRLFSSTVGLIPTTPLVAGGQLFEPSVSVPAAAAPHEPLR